MNDSMKDIEEIKVRNARVELDKAWETSWTRRIFIGAMTFIIASIWLKIIDGENIFLKALIPTGGYILSTLSLPAIKRIWIGNT
ncbi:MAG: hypothetical protein A2928_04695 [Candidatus Taylorbacteria bacterium RIFCSPLOWO2_01_FULL_45_15b]|uniref:Uncharacterized protein n=1 Tax=Candidatus Taylorbacteria bacterium RIFCSPLOWO2_01_FULL_45_15b TaxID=1802319 RepID=A0A1G2NDP1_9BACT|nr:MAG: hypothetical protein A2928_04695 [Candidatus Taylorbacteria bacterium RIFCSPLOWO2_01_FULL_45_15b]